MKTLFGFHQDKAYAAILYLATNLEDTDRIKILKAMYFADKYHLNRYFRFITGDRYARLPRGPVASNIYNILQEDSEYFSVSGMRIKALQEPDMDYLSPSDVNALDEAIKYCKGKSSMQLSELSHDDIYDASDDHLISAEDFINHMENKDAIFHAHNL